MRDLQHWKDKVELSLDGRQVFFLFFGGAVLACMLFALGVMTGRRIEARAIALEAPSSEDPLAALDQLGDLEDEELTYHRALTKDGGRTHGKEARPSLSKPPIAAPVAPKPAPAAKPVAPSPAPKPASAHASAPMSEESEAPGALPAPPRVAPKLAAAKPAPVVPKPAPVVAHAMKGEIKDGASEAGQGHYTLQLSAFTAKKDADDLMHRVQAAGYKPFVVASDVPGKGVVFRVRVGDFASKEVAMTERTSVESRLKVSAYLTKL